MAVSVDGVVDGPERGSDVARGGSGRRRRYSSVRRKTATAAKCGTGSNSTEWKLMRFGVSSPSVIRRVLGLCMTRKMLEALLPVVVVWLDGLPAVVSDIEIRWIVRRSIQQHRLLSVMAAGALNGVKLNTG